MNDKKKENGPVEELISATDMVELKRDMQSAKIADWLQNNQQQLIAGAVIIVVVLIGLSLWKEQQLTQSNSAALLYMKATNITDKQERTALLDSVIKDYADTGYATLARLQKAKNIEAADKTLQLEALVEGHAAPELSWQARLDLAELFIQEGKIEEAKAVLAERLGKHYEQARYALLARVASDKDEKMSLIQKSLDAELHDNDLVAELEAELAQLRAEK